MPSQARTTSEQMLLFALPDEHLLLVDDHVKIGGGEAAGVFELQFGSLVVNAVLEFGEVAQFNVELQAAHAREIVFARVEEHAVEERGGGIQGGGISRAHLAIHLDQRFLGSFQGISPQGLADHHSGFIALREEHLDFREAGLLNGVQGAGGKLVVRLEHHFPGRRIHNVSGSEGAFQILAPRLRLV